MEGIFNIHASAGNLFEMPLLETVGLMKVPVVIKISERLFPVSAIALVMPHTVRSLQFNATRDNITRIIL